VTLRMGSALLALVGVLVSTYLYLYKLGLLGAIACGTGGCETVQLSEYSRFLGIEVPLIGLLGYLAILGVALAGIQPKWESARWPAQALLGLTTGGVAFTVYLTWIELFVLHAICRWCVGSAVIIVLLFVLALLDIRRHRHA